MGEIKKLTTTVLPNNVTDKSITWRSSDEDIVKISNSGEITANKPGEVNISASTSNEKTDIIKIVVKEEKKPTNDIVVKELTNTSNTQDTNSEESDGLLGMISLVVLGGGGYLLYKKLKK